MQSLSSNYVAIQLSGKPCQKGVLWLYFVMMLVYRSILYEFFIVALYILFWKFTMFSVSH